MKLLYKLMVCGLILSMGSCNKYLEIKPDKSSDLQITKIEDLEYILNNYLNFFQEEDMTRFLYSDDYGLYKKLYDARAAAYWIVYVQRATWNTEYTSNDGRDVFWFSEYRKIFYANMILWYLPKVAGSDSQKKNLEYEARFIRACSMWVLAQAYCLPYTEANKKEPGLTLKTTTSTEEPANRATLEDTYKMIESDLTEALKLQTKLVTIGGSKFKIIRASKDAVNAFAARYYLYRNDYVKALQYANIALGEHSDMMDYNTDMRYSSTVTNVNVGGVPVRIWFPYTYLGDWTTNMLEWKELYYLRMLNNGQRWYIPSQELLDLYDKDYDLRYKYHMVANCSYYNRVTNYQYPGYCFFYLTYVPSGPTVAEMHMIRAECLARNNDIPGAMAAINTLRAKRMDKNAPADRINLSAGTRSEALAKIFDERRREMPFVLRWWDIRRLNSNEDPTDDVGDINRSFYSYNVTGVVTADGVKTYTLPKNSRKYATPIPGTEIISSNGVIKQNTY